MFVTYVQLIVGTSVGSKVTAVAEKVATDTAEDLKQAAGSFEGDIPGIQPVSATVPLRSNVVEHAV